MDDVEAMSLHYVVCGLPSVQTRSYRTNVDNSRSAICTTGAPTQMARSTRVLRRLSVKVVFTLLTAAIPSSRIARQKHAAGMAIFAPTTNLETGKKIYVSKEDEMWFAMDGCPYRCRTKSEV